MSRRAAIGSRPAIRPMDGAIAATVLSLTLSRRTSAFRLVRIWLRCPSKMPGALTIVARGTRLVVGVIATASAGFICSCWALTVAILLFLLAFAVLVALFLLFLEASHVLVKGGATKVVRVKSTVLVRPLDAGSDFVIRIRNLYCGL